MRELVLKMELSLDGFVGAADGDVEWVHPSYDDDLTEYTVGVLGGAGAHLMGRITYEDMAEHWPTADEPFAAPMNEIPKVVFSSGLERAEWGPVEVRSGGLSKEIAELKDQDGGYLLAHGGASFGQALVGHGLVDEYRLNVHPFVVGQGLPLFSERLRLEVRDARRFPSGAVAVTARPSPGSARR